MTTNPPDHQNGPERFEVTAELDGERLDVGISRLTGMSRNKVAQLVDDDLVVVAGRRVSRSLKLDTGMIIELLPNPEPVAAEIEQPVLELLYLDNDVVAVDKPVGIAAHPSPGWQGPTVTDALVAQGISLADSGADERQGVVHRLDVGTSGVMILARTPGAYSKLKSQFKTRTVSKTYHALVQGHPDPSTGTIDAPLARHPSHDYKFAVVAGGKPSITHYMTLEAFRYASLLEINLETGRTHQIRVHMSSLRHPCCGDITYGADPKLAERLGLSRQWLHATQLTFDHPATGERMTLTSPYPPDLAHALEILES